MSSRNHSVVVTPQHWRGPTAELAQLLGPLTGVPARQLAAVLERGPVTVESDLSSEAAQALCARLTKLGVPASVHTGELQVVESEASADTFDIDDALIDDMFAGLGSSESTGDEPAATTGHTEAVEDVDAAEDTGWGALFPDLAVGAEPEPEEDAAPPPPSLDALESGEVEFAPPAPDPEVVPRPPRDPGPKVAPPAPEIEAPPAPAPEAPRKADEPGAPPLATRRFDGSRLHDALLPSQTERPPYAPTGFDDRPEHAPAIAQALSVFAPGAGQIYNGQSERALDYGLRFFLVAPWIESVREAGRRAEKIRTYWAPWPPAGSFLRAVRYVALWWLCVGASAAAVVWIGGRLWEVAKREPQPLMTANQLADAHQDAETKVRAARLAAYDALQEASLRNPVQQFTMSDEERARRLFSIGYEHCAARQYALCEATMKRVAKLSPRRGDALKLQAWASHQRNSHANDPMPEVGPIPTLTDLELQELRDEMPEASEVFERPVLDAAEGPAPSDDSPAPPVEPQQ